LAADPPRDGFAGAVAAYRAGDHGTALEGWRSLADEGNSLAQYNVGLLHYRGHGTTRSYAQALIWFHAAARQGLAASYLRLGAMFEGGEGVPRDFEQAYLWYTLAVSAFGPGPCRDKALERRRLLAKNLTEAQVLKVLAESSEWAPAPIGGDGQPCFKSIAIRPDDRPAAGAGRAAMADGTTGKETALIPNAVVSKLPEKMSGEKKPANVPGLSPAGETESAEAKTLRPLPTVDVAKRKVHTVKTPGEEKPPARRTVALAPRGGAAKPVARAPAPTKPAIRAMAPPKTDPLSNPKSAAADPVKPATHDLAKPETASPIKPAGNAAPASRGVATNLARATSSAPRRGKDFYVQLGALSSREMADQVWRRLSQRNSDIFGDRQQTIETMRAKSGKVLFRLFAGPFGTSGKANAFCATLKKRDEACFVPRSFRKPK
jgi:cell division septation protein DedD